MNVVNRYMRVFERWQIPIDPAEAENLAMNRARSGKLSLESRNRNLFLHGEIWFSPACRGAHNISETQLSRESEKGDEWDKRQNVLKWLLVTCFEYTGYKMRDLVR